MNCTNCGAPLNPGANFCTSCGATVQQPTYQQPTYQQPTYQQPTYQQPYQENFVQPPVTGAFTWKEFYNRFVTKKGYITGMSIICFITAALSLVLLALTGNVLAVMDIVVYLSMGIALLATKNWICALIPTVYGGIFSVINVVSGGTPSSVVAIIVGVLATQTLLKANKAYQQYKLNGTFPNEPI